MHCDAAWTAPWRDWAASTFSNCTKPLRRCSVRATLPAPGNTPPRSGIKAIGASVSDLESAEIAIAGAAYGILQFPYNVAQQTFADILDRAAARGMKIAVNRPFGMGRMLYENREVTKAGAFGFILEKRFEGVILSGTKSPQHLEENWEAFGEALAHPASRWS